MSTIAFIGLGNMGYPMSKNLLKAGYNVIGFDLVAENCNRLVSVGGQTAASIADAVAVADIVISMVPTGKHVRAVYEGPDGVLQHARPGTLLIDSSTIDVENSRAVSQAAEAAGFVMVDAPVSGAVPAAEAGTLVFMVGGTKEAFDRVVPTLTCMGTSLVHVGAAGCGQAMKICNNMMAGMSMVALSEALTLAERLGLDYQTVYDVVTKGSGNCWALQAYCPVPGPVPASPANRDYAAGFSMAMMLKDMLLSQSAAADVSTSTPTAASAAALYQKAVDNGYAAKDFSFIFNLVSGRTGVSNENASD
ncbi:3-hydroxyisobutyrate dehydrogenase [Pollutimonas subterranea]|uniref:3-hydroxyisobutyrate dehydrogenase n=1 Tax=Pollutimonas subterranea TaxID=2045210 RepID=A0A2N4U2H8_9BURK|nr:3-hydroxyisobutyrate dehydrogenase [Pollutimonas subterranea]PLC49218.1 3-hydroxyisobutyrate dehydrogenase [Pollutimonas subterranea]